MGAVKTLLTFEEFEQLEDTGESLELLDGDLIRLPPPQKKHMLDSERLFKSLDGRLERMRQHNPQYAAGKVPHEMGYLLRGNPSSWFISDVSVTWPDQPGDRYYERSPMIAIEIVSEYDLARNIERKVARYLEQGAAEVWIFYPESRHAVVHSHTRGIERRENSFLTTLLPGIEIPFEEFL
jgi:Uma2 family endonuclease